MEKGSVLMEAIICLPVLLLVSLGVAQFAHIWLCRNMVQYAAFCAARATLTAPAGDQNERRWAREAAQEVCATVSFLNPNPNPNTSDFSFPGIGLKQGTGRVRQGENSNEPVLLVNLDPVDEYGNTIPKSDWRRGVEVRMGVPLLFPLAGPVIGKTMQLFSGTGFSPARINPLRHDRWDSYWTTRLLTGEDFPRIYLKEQFFIVKPFKSTWSAD